METLQCVHFVTKFATTMRSGTPAPIQGGCSCKPYLLDMNWASNKLSTFSHLDLRICSTTTPLCFSLLWWASGLQFTWRCGSVSGFDVHEEHPREEYLARLKNIRRKVVNKVTFSNEPRVPFWKLKLPYAMFSLSMVLFLVCTSTPTASCMCHITFG
jgi:hypothetical protein